MAGDDVNIILCYIVQKAFGVRLQPPQISDE